MTPTPGQFAAAGGDPAAGWFEEDPAPKKKAPFSSTAATLKWARSVWGDEAVAISSWWQAAGKLGGVRKDLLGFIDAVALDGLPGVLALQACGTDVSSHLRKMAGEVPDSKRIKPEKALKAAIDAAKLAGRVRRWLLAGNRVLIVAWRDKWVDTGPKTKRKQKVPRFLAAELVQHPGALPERPHVEWHEHEVWPPLAKGEGA